MKKIGKAQGPWTYTHFHYFNSSSEHCHALRHTKCRRLVGDVVGEKETIECDIFLM